MALIAARHFAAQGLKVKLVTLIPGHPVAHALPDGIPLLELGAPTHRSWWARAGRFALAQLDKLIRLVFQLQLRWFAGWFQARVDPGERGLAMQLFRVGTEATAGFRFRQLRRQFRCQRPHRVLGSAHPHQHHLLLCRLGLADPPRGVRAQRPLASAAAGGVAAPAAPCLSPGGCGDSQHSRRSRQLWNPWGPGSGWPCCPIRCPVCLQLLSAVGRSNATGFITVARLVPQKGLDVLIAALPRLSGAAAAWPVTLVGDGPERDTLQAQAQDLGVSDRLRCLGFRSDPERFLADAAVFVLPSRFEGMPNALLEAMAAGLAVIVTDASPGPLEVVEPGVSGLVVPSDDPIALAAAMQELAADPERCRRMGAAARARIAALDWPQLEPLWRSILALS